MKNARQWTQEAIFNINGLLRAIKGTQAEYKKSLSSNIANNIFVIILEEIDFCLGDMFDNANCYNGLLYAAWLLRYHLYHLKLDDTSDFASYLHDINRELRKIPSPEEFNVDRSEITHIHLYEDNQRFLETIKIDLQIC